MRPFPIERYLQPGPRAAVPDGFTCIRQDIVGVLPHRIALDEDITLVVRLQTGLATTWRDVASDACITRRAASREAFDPSADPPPVGDVRRPAVWLMAVVNGTLRSSAPLIAS